jgi:hypothetical protein
MFNCGSDYLDDAMLKIRGLFPLGDTENQPLVLYAISFGFDYCQPPAEGDTSPGGGSLLYRAAKKYGGGECLSAADPDELDDALREALNLIKNDAQSFVAPVVPVSQTNRTESGDRLYVALFAPREGQQEWPGNIKKYGLDRNNGTICNASAGPPSCTIGSGAATTADGTILGSAESAAAGRRARRSPPAASAACCSRATSRTATSSRPSRGRRVPSSPSPRATAGSRPRCSG